jgi:L-asparaginase
MILIANSESEPGFAAATGRLRAGASALDAVEAGIRLVESDPTVRSVGFNSWPNMLGEVELDAAIMDGTSLRTGAVGALVGFHHPISVARQVLERLPHEILVGPGAARFAAEVGAEKLENLTPASKAAWQGLVSRLVPPEQRDSWQAGPLAALCQAATDPEMQKDTTVFLAMDGAGELASGVSTSGWAWKYPGRLGDSPIIGAGSYADTQHGACACTHTGEMTIRAGTARSVVLYLKMGLTLEDAVAEAARDLGRLKGGLLQDVTIHAIDAGGQHRVVSVSRGAAAASDIEYWLWTPSMTMPERRLAERFAL